MIHIRVDGYPLLRIRMDGVPMRLVMETVQISHLIKVENPIHVVLQGRHALYHHLHHHLRPCE
jgi:hypothetical protein